MASCPRATGAVKLLTLCVIKEAVLETPFCRPIDFVDDTKLRAIGGLRTAAAQLGKAVNITLAAARQVELPVNRSKSCFMVGDIELPCFLLDHPDWSLGVCH